MKKQINLFLLTIVTIFFSINVYAIPITLEDTTVFSDTDAYDSVTSETDLVFFGRGDVNYLSTDITQSLTHDYDYVNWNHQFSFDPALDYILSGTLSLNIREANSGNSTDHAFIFSENGTLYSGEIATSVYDFDVTSSFLADGLFNVNVASILGEFYLDSSTLTVTYESSLPGHSVPEPSTLAIMSLGLIFIAFVQISRRRRSSYCSLTTA